MIPAVILPSLAIILAGTMTEQDIINIGTLYKYRDAYNENNWGVLDNSQLWFPTPDTFNDPFDANILVRYDLLPDEDMDRMLEDYVRLDFPYDGYFLRKKRKELLRQQLLNPDVHDSVVQAWIQRIVSKVRMFCVCPERDNQLLWAHYANNHTGFAIGFKPEEFLRIWNDNNGVTVGPVLYLDEYPEILPPVSEKALTEEATFIKMMNVKSTVWEYEKEIRFTLFDGPKSAYFPPKLISEVVMGCRMKSEHQQRLLTTMDAKYPHATVLRARMRRGAFALDFDKIRG